MIIFIARTISQQAQIMVRKYSQFGINFKKFGAFTYNKKKALAVARKTV